MTNVRPGDLAIVFNCPDSPFNGATCEVLGPPMTGFPLDLAYSGWYWSVRFARSMPWMAWTGDTGLYGREGAFPDQFLRKLGGEDLAEGLLQQRLRELAQELKEPA